MALCTSMIGGTGKHSQNLLDTVIYFFLQVGPLHTAQASNQRGYTPVENGPSYRNTQIWVGPYSLECMYKWHTVSSKVQLYQHLRSCENIDCEKESHKNDELTLRVSAVWYGAGHCVMCVVFCVLGEVSDVFRWSHLASSLPGTCSQTGDSTSWWPKEKRQFLQTNMWLYFMVFTSSSLFLHSSIVRRLPSSLNSS